MEGIDIINSILKYFVTNICIYFVLLKITNNKNINKKETILIILFSILLSLICAISVINISSMIILPILYFIYSIILSKIIKHNMLYSATVTIISLVITYVVYTISTVIGGICLNMLFSDINYNNPIGLLVVSIIMSLILYLFFKIKRFKNGFNFIKSYDSVEKMGLIGLPFGGIVMIGTALLNQNNSTTFNAYLVSGNIIIAITFISWLQASITKKYKENMKERTIEIQKAEIDSQNKMIEELKENNIQLSAVIHRYNNRFSALENAIIKALNQNNKVEVSSELLVMLDELKKMSKNFSEEVIESTERNIELPTTGIIGIDNIFKYMSDLAIKNNIKFDLKINDRINFLINNIIQKEELETIIGDHIRDAIIAINSSNSKNRSIMTILGIIEDSYELCIYDTGIEFEIETLKNLGIKRVTTHANDGGTGIGFMTTFDILRKYNGSLIIEEYNNSENNNYYTKAVIIRFDSKNEYKIRSYRANKIKSKIKDNRIIIETID